jgi:hypothetical protein
MHNSPIKEGKCTASDEQQVALVEATTDGSGFNARDAVPVLVAADSAAAFSTGYEMSARSANSNNNNNEVIFFSLKICSLNCKGFRRRYQSAGSRKSPSPCTSGQD